MLPYNTLMHTHKVLTYKHRLELTRSRTTHTYTYLSKEKKFCTYIYIIQQFSWLAVSKKSCTFPFPLERVQSGQSLRIHAMLHSTYTLHTRLKYSPFIVSLNYSTISISSSSSCATLNAFCVGFHLLSINCLVTTMSHFLLKIAIFYTVCKLLNVSSTLPGLLVTRPVSSLAVC